MSVGEDKYGSLLFLRKTGEPGTSFPLCTGTTCIGSSIDADIRLKLKDERLEEIHCIIDVTENGIATILNKSIKTPICVNTISIKRFKVLRNEDEIYLLGKKFQYINDNILEEDINMHQASLNKVINTPSKKRQSVAPLVSTQSTKKTSNFKTKTPVQKRSLARKSFNGRHNDSMTPERKLGESRMSERSKTTSKLIVSKALGSPRRPKKRRLSMDDNLGKYDKNLKVSERNILLSDNIISSTILEEEELTASRLKVGNKNADFLDLSNRSFSAAEFSPVEQTLTRRSSLRTPSRSSVRIRVTEPTPVKTPKSSNRKSLLTPAKSENKDKTLEHTPLIDKKPGLLKGTPKSARKTRKSENIVNIEVEETSRYSNEEAPLPSSSNVPPQQVSDKIKSKQKSFGSFPSPNTSMSTRRKTEGCLPTGNVLDQHPRENSLTPSIGRKSNITSVGSTESSEGMVFLNLSFSSISSTSYRTGLSSTDSDSFEGEVSKDPRISRRKSLQRTRQTEEHVRRSSGIKSVAEATPKHSNVEASLSSSSNVPQLISDMIKSRQKSFGSFPQRNKSMSTRRKTEGSIPTGNMVDRKRISNITSIDSADLSVILNLSDTSVSPIPPRTGSSSMDSDPFEDEISKDPRLSLGKVSPRKSIQRTLQTNQLSKRLSGIQSVGDFSTERQEEILKDNLNNSNLRRSVRRSNSLSSKREENLSLNLSRQSDGDKDESLYHQSKLEDTEDHDLATFSRASTTRRYFRKNNIDDVSGNESSSGDSSLCNLQDESFTSSTPSKSSNSDVFEPLSADRSRRSSRRTDQIKRESSMSEQSEISDIKPIFVPQRRRPLRSYIDENKELSVCLSKSTTLEGEPSQRHSESVVETKDETDSLNQSALSKSNISTRISARRSTGKYCKSCEISPVKTTTPRRSSVRDSTSSIFSQSLLSENDALSSTAESPKVTPKSKRSFSMNQSQSEEEISVAEHTSITSKRLSRTNTSNKSYNGSVITVEDDSIKGTPENNTSIVILDTPLEKPQRKSHKRLSKTLDSSIDDCAELTTPKSAIKSRRSKSLPYKPIVEEITPATPQEVSGRSESGFKTPLNTPGLFENIKKSVLKSRSRRLPSNNLMEEWNKTEGNQATKRFRESTESTDRSPKKRKVLADTTLDSTLDEELDASFSSFGTDELFATDDNDQYVAPNTPHDFRNLTDKPLITDPQTKCLTEPRRQRKAPNRRSLHAMRLESQFSESEKMSSSRSSNSSEISDSLANSSVGSRRSRRLSSRAEKDPQTEVEKTPKNKRTPKEAKSPKNDLTNVAGVKKLLSTPKVANSPKNDLTQIPNLRKLVHPVQQRSPKNDLSNVAGVKKLLGTPKEVKTPRNDLRNVPNLRKIMSPKQQNSPRNDLSDVAGLKKLLSTPKKQKEPKNDLTNVAGVKKLMSTPRQQNSPLNDLTKVPNLRRVMSPKQQNSPRNDLSDVAGLKKLLSTPKKQKEPRNDLTNVAGVKKLMSTPRQQNSPLNDLTKVPNLRRVMSPRQENSPRNDLSDVEGIANIFTVAESHNNESDTENNENLFDKLFVKKPIRTYRGKSLSPNNRKAVLFGRGQRKTLGDTPVSSPRIEKWLKDQAVMSLERVDDAEKSSTEEDKSSEAPQRTRKRKVVDTEEEAENLVKKKPRGRANTRLVVAVEKLVVESPRTLRSRRRAASPMTDIIDSTSTASKVKSPAPTKRGRVRKVSEKEDMIQQVPEIHSTTQDDKEDVKVATQPKRRGKQRIIATDEILNTPEPQPNTRRRAVKKDEQSSDTEALALPRRRGRPRSVSVDEKVNSTNRRKAPKKDDEPADTENSTSRREVLRNEDKSTDTEVTPLPKRRGRHVNVSADEKVDSSKRGRKVLKKDEEEPAETEITPLPKRRGRRANVSADEKVDSSRRGGKVLKKDEDESASTENCDTEVTPLPKRRGRHANVSADEKVDSSRRGRKVLKKDEDEPAATENSDTEITPLPKRTGRHANVSADEKVDSSRRGKKVLKKDEDEPAATENSKATKKVLKKEDKNSDSEITPLPKRRGRNVNVAGDEKVDSNKSGRRVLKKEDVSGETEVTPLPQRRGRRRNDSVDEIINSGSKRRKVPKKVESTSDEEKDVEIEIKNKKQPRGKNQKAKHATQIEEEIAEPAKRTRRQIIVIDDDELPEEENKENVQANAPKRKETRRKNQKPDPVLEEVDVPEEKPKESGPTKTKGRRQPAKPQVDKIKQVEAEETSENSPRSTRQRKGMYKKYGSEFITKSVSFEENGIHEEKKRKAKVVEQTEETENPIRRSKRTRK